DFSSPARSVMTLSLPSPSASTLANQPLSVGSDIECGHLCLSQRTCRSVLYSKLLPNGNCWLFQSDSIPESLFGGVMNQDGARFWKLVKLG
ncbi:hypothetical protein BOX15_Mlig031922g1, partial [Macrostomum lignano]